MNCKTLADGIIANVSKVIYGKERQVKLVLTLCFLIGIGL